MSRTIVGSWPRRRALPEGREALERALDLLRAWPCDHTSARALERRSTPTGSAAKAARLVVWPSANMVESEEAYVDWLPERYRDMSVAGLLAELRRLDEVTP